MNKDKHDFDVQGPQYPYRPSSEPHTESHRLQKEHQTEETRQQEYLVEPITEAYHHQEENITDPYTTTERETNSGQGTVQSELSTENWAYTSIDASLQASPSDINSFSTPGKPIPPQEPRIYPGTSYKDLLAIIHSEQPSAKRAAAVRTLGQFEQHDSKRVLMAALMDTDTMVRVAALEACTTLAHQIPTAIVEVALSDTSWFVRASAMWAFSYFGDKAPRKRIAALADDEEESIQVRYWALYALGEIHDKESAYRFLQLLNNQNTDEQLREIAAISLGRLGPLDDKFSDLAITILRDRLRSQRETPIVRIAAAHALAQRSSVPDDETLSILFMALTDKNKQIRAAVEYALDIIVGHLIIALHKPFKPGQTYTMLMNVLCKLADRVSERIFENLLFHTDVAVRQAALQILNTPDKELAPARHSFGYVLDKHIQQHIKSRGVKGKAIGAGYVYLLTPQDLKEALLPQALDGHWIPRSLLHLIMSQGEEKKFSYTDISPYLNKQLRTEYIRSLIHGRSVVIPVSLLYSTPTLFNDFLPQRANREAFKWLLTTGAIIPMLTTESSPDQPSAFTPSTNGFAAWQRICQEVRMLCVRFSWNDSSYQEIERQFLQALQKAIERLAPVAPKIQQDENIPTSTTHKLVKSLQTTARAAGSTTSTELLEDLYEEFLLVAGSRSREHFYDGTKPYASEVKQTIDFAYNKNLADTIQSRLLTPADTPSLTALQIWKEDRPTHKQNRLTILHIMKLMTTDLFPNIRTSRYLKSLRLLNLQNIVELRSSHSWNEYVDEVQQLYISTPEDVEQRLVSVYQKYTDLAVYITAMLDSGEQRQQTEIYTNWTPTPTLQLNIASAILFISWSADDVFYNFSSNGPETDVTGKAFFTARFFIGEWQHERPTHDLAISFDFMHGSIDDAKTLWETLKEQLQKHLNVVQLKQVAPLKAGPELSR